VHATGATTAAERKNRRIEAMGVDIIRVEEWSGVE